MSTRRLLCQQESAQHCAHPRVPLKALLPLAQVMKSRQSVGLPPSPALRTRCEARHPPAWRLAAAATRGRCAASRQRSHLCLQDALLAMPVGKRARAALLQAWRLALFGRTRSADKDVRERDEGAVNWRRMRVLHQRLCFEQILLPTIEI